MTDRSRVASLRVVLVVVGLIFLVGVFPLTRLWPAGWSWGTRHSHYLMMILGVYATLGVFLIVASRNPLAHRSLIWFTVWSSVVHGLIMLVQSFTTPGSHGHLMGDVPALFIVAAVLAVLTPRSGQRGWSARPA